MISNFINMIIIVREYFKKNNIKHTKASFFVGAFTIAEVIAAYTFMFLTFWTGNLTLQFKESLKFR